jgi:hypothetical protein
MNFKKLIISLLICLPIVIPTTSMDKKLIGKRVTLEDVEEKMHPGRKQNYKSLQAYLESFAESHPNHGKPKILIIGGGLAYDDLVKGVTPHFLSFEIDDQRRQLVYPHNAYLVDLDGKFVNYFGPPTNYASLSDSHADISKKMGESGGLPNEFKDQFDIVILESLPFQALTKVTFINCWSCLKPGGKLISHNHISRDPELTVSSTYEDYSSNQQFETFSITDSSSHQLTVFYPLPGPYMPEHNKFFLFLPEQKLDIRKFVEEKMQSTDNHYIGQIHKQIREHARSKQFFEKLTIFSAKLMPNLASIELNFEITWYGVASTDGFLVWHKGH